MKMKNIRTCMNQEKTLHIQQIQRKRLQRETKQKKNQNTLDGTFENKIFN